MTSKYNVILTIGSETFMLDEAQSEDALFAMSVLSKAKRLSYAPHPVQANGGPTFCVCNVPGYYSLQLQPLTYATHLTADEYLELQRKQEEIKKTFPDIELVKSDPVDAWPVGPFELTRTAYMDSLKRKDSDARPTAEVEDDFDPTQPFTGQ